MDGTVVYKPYMTKEDFQSLMGTKWLNDGVVNAFLQWLSALVSDDGVRTHAFSSYFFDTFKDGDVDSDEFHFDSVETWSDKVGVAGDIFAELDHLFIPINKDGIHWALIVVDFEKRVVLGLDSLKNSCRKHCKIVLHCLELEYEKKYGETLPRGFGPDEWSWQDTGVDIAIPRQTNGNDCGVFVCMYAYCHKMQLPLIQESFNQEKIDSKDVRKRIGLAVLNGTSLDG